MPSEVLGFVAGGVSGGLSALGSSAEKKAASQAAAAQAGATEAQLALGRESMALGKDMYNANYGVLSPYASRGNVAGNAINALLGLPNAPVMTSPLALPGGGTSGAGGGSGGGLYSGQAPYTPAQILAMRSDGIPGNAEAAQHSLDAWNASHPAGTPQTQPGTPTGTPSSTPMAPAPVRPTFNDLRELSPQDRVAARQDYRTDAAAYRTAHPATPAAGTPAAGGTPASASPLSALTNFSNSAGMQFAQREGANAVNMGAAGNGWLESGAALQALQQRGQDIALQQYFPMYTGLLSQQQAVGAGAASSIAGVGSNFANSAANINAGMGANIQNGANAQSNAALLRGQANSNMWNQIGSSFGRVAGSIG